MTWRARTSSRRRPGAGEPAAAPAAPRRSQRPVARLVERDPRLHVAARAEDVANAALAALLRRRGWVPRVIGYTGYGGPGWVRVLGRVVISRPGAREREASEPGGSPAPPLHLPAALEELREVASGALRGWRAFFSAPLQGARVQVTVAGRTHELVSGRGGYLDARLPSALEPGEHRVRMDVVDAADAVSEPRVVVVDGDVRHGVVSDIDDTVMITSLPRPLIAAWNTFVLPEHARRPVPGMAELLCAARDAHPGCPVVYVSTGAWNTAGVLRRFMAAHGYPRGPLLLTDWGPTNTGWFRSGVEHKRHALARLAEDFPAITWLLVGDDGQHDPDTYARFAASAPDRVRGIAIRQLTHTEQVLSRASFVPVAVAGPTASGGGPAIVAVPQVRAPDGDGLLHQLRQAGAL